MFPAVRAAQGLPQWARGLRLWNGEFQRRWQGLEFCYLWGLVTWLPQFAHAAQSPKTVLLWGWQLLPCGFKQKSGSEGTSGSGFRVCRDPSCPFRTCWTLQSLWGCVQCLKACDSSALRRKEGLCLQGQWLLLTSSVSNSSMCYFVQINSPSDSCSFHSHWIIQTAIFFLLKYCLTIQWIQISEIQYKTVKVVLSSTLIECLSASPCSLILGKCRNMTEAGLWFLQVTSHCVLYRSWHL